jgi:hypothetical protein
MSVIEKMKCRIAPAIVRALVVLTSVQPKQSTKNADVLLTTEDDISFAAHELADLLHEESFYEASQQITKDREAAVAHALSKEVRQFTKIDVIKILRDSRTLQREKLTSWLSSYGITMYKETLDTILQLGLLDTKKEVEWYQAALENQRRQTKASGLSGYDTFEDLREKGFKA